MIFARCFTSITLMLHLYYVFRLSLLSRNNLVLVKAEPQDTEKTAVPSPDAFGNIQNLWPICIKNLRFWNMAKIQKTREQGDEILLSSSIPGVTTVGFAYLAHTILLWFYGIANL